MNEITLNGFQITTPIISKEIIIMNVIAGLYYKKSLLFAGCASLVLSLIIAFSIKFDYDFLGIFSIIILILSYVFAFTKNHL